MHNSLLTSEGLGDMLDKQEKHLVKAQISPITIHRAHNLLPKK